jgi:hypothetical protein
VADSDQKEISPGAASPSPHPHRESTLQEGVYDRSERMYYHLSDNPL